MAEPALLIHHTAEAPEPVRFAALELARYLGRMTDRSFPVVQAPAAAWAPLELRPGAAAIDRSVEGRLERLKDAFAGAGASLRVSLGVRRYLLARGSPGAAAAARAAREAHDRFAALQTPERLRAGTLWTGAWRRDAGFAEWEREAAAPSPGIAPRRAARDRPRAIEERP
ncbi:MAG TPA: hypothetical protein VGM69_07990 [Chloroflexota bacterium]|jgi:hypothetical protein